MAFVERGLNDRAQHHLRSGLQMLGIELPDNGKSVSKLKVTSSRPCVASD